MVIVELWPILSWYIIPLRVMGGEVAHFVYVLLCFSLTWGASNIITTPSEVVWMSSQKRVMYERRAAASKWNIQGEASQRPMRKVSQCIVAPDEDTDNF